MKKETIKTLYVLELDKTDYYIGFTSKEVNSLLEKFQSGWKKTPAYIQQHASFTLLKTLPLGRITQDQAQRYCSAYAVRMMDKVGFQHVRGGKFTLTDPQAHFETVRNQLNKGEIEYIELLQVQIEEAEPFPEKFIY